MKHKKKPKEVGTMGHRWLDDDFSHNYYWALSYANVFTTN